MIAGQSPADCETFISPETEYFRYCNPSPPGDHTTSYTSYTIDTIYTVNTIYTLSTHYLHYTQSTHYLRTIYPLSTHAGRARGLVSAPPLHGVLPRAAAPRGHRHQLLQLLPAPPPGLRLHTQERFAATCYMFVSGQWMFCKKHKVFLVRINILISLCNFSRKSPFEHEY